MLQDMSKEMELRGTAQQQSADSAMDSYEPEVMEALAESENELVAALQREGLQCACEGTADLKAQAGMKKQQGYRL